MARSKKNLKIAVFIIAYNAIDTIVEVYNRIPENVKKVVKEIYVIDDCSQDATYEKISAFKKKNSLKKLSIFRNSKNLGYGGNQKKGYEYAINMGYDFVIMLHGDAQYAPEKLIDLISSFQNHPNSNLGMVMGSRMLGDPIGGGMPIHKYVGNKVLTWVENFFLDSNLSEFHSGYRGYNCKILASVPFQLCSDGFSFDTEIIIMLMQRGYEIMEVSIPTHYGNEICRVPLVRYGLNCIRAVGEYKLSQLGWMNFERYVLKSDEERKNVYELKRSPFSSHSIINETVGDLVDGNKTRVLDIACGKGTLFKFNLKKVEAIGLDSNTVKNSKYSKFVEVDITNYEKVKTLNLGKFDIIIAADILEHLSDPDEALIFYTQFLKRDGKFILSVPNVANFFIRFSLLFGVFNYSNKGILDRTHLRFFTRSSILNLVRSVGLDIKYVCYTSIPIELVIPGLLYFKKDNLFMRIISKVTNFFPTLFAYQFVIVAGKKS